MAAAGGEGRGGVVNKAVAAGMLGLQLLSLPFAFVAGQGEGHPPHGVEELPRLEVLPLAAQARAPRTLEEEMIGEWFVFSRRSRYREQVFTHPPIAGTSPWACFLFSPTSCRFIGARSCLDVALLPETRTIPLLSCCPLLHI